MVAGRHAKQKTRSRSAKLGGRAAVGLSTTAGAFLAAAVGSAVTAPPGKADFGIDDLIMNLFDPAAIVAAVDPAVTVDLSTTLADLGLSGSGTTDATALAITDLPGSVVAAAADPGAVAAAAADPAATLDLSTTAG